jgi:hypothetical protein
MKDENGDLLEKFNKYSYKSPVRDQIPAELIQAGRRTFLTETHKLINSAWNKEGLFDECKQFIIAQIYKKKGGGTDYSNYHGISLLST